MLGWSLHSCLCMLCSGTWPPRYQDSLNSMKIAHPGHHGSIKWTGYIKHPSLKQKKICWPKRGTAKLASVMCFHWVQKYFFHFTRKNVCCYTNLLVWTFYSIHCVPFFPKKCFIQVLVYYFQHCEHASEQRDRARLHVHVRPGWFLLQTQTSNSMLAYTRYVIVVCSAIVGI